MNGTPQIRIYSVIVGLGLLILFAIFRFPASDTSSSTHGSGRSPSTNFGQTSKPSRTLIHTNNGVRVNVLGGIGTGIGLAAQRGATEKVSDDEVSDENRKIASDMGPVKGRRLTNILTNELSQ